MFITLEGIDRSGKTTQAAMLAEALGPDTLLIREPGGTEMAERVRSLLKDPALEMGDVAELLLFSAARADLVERVIEPARAEGRDVVCDRFVDSTAAYQGAARGIGVDVVEDLMSLVAGSCMPDVTVLLRVDPDTAHARGQQRLAAGEEDGSDRFESEGVEFQRSVAAAYDELAARHPDRIVVVDGEGDPGEVHQRVLDAVGRSVPAERE
ncbi:MAG TPA: dTMP kinase [Solirubrobacterales bacterium]|nr:dTMP kinase [Solirubrobacterales bacterium]